MMETNRGRLQNLERDTELVRKGTVSLMSSGRLPADYYTAGSFDPERGFLSIIARHVSSANAIDVGANRGDFTYALRKAGFDVDAFEPRPDLAADLKRRFAQDNKVRVHRFACSDRDGTANLQFASADDPALDTTLFSTLETHNTFDGLNFERGAEVRLCRLDTVLAPKAKYSVGLLKTDTEGHDIAVLNGAKKINAEVLLVEYWDEHFIFNSGTTHNTIKDYLASFDKARFPLCVIMWRGISRGEFGFIVGPAATPRGSWGNLLFARDASLVDEIVEWARSTYGSDRVVSGAAPIADVIKTPAGLNSP